jgi:acetolactate synthase-1/2/3 large subunit
MATEFQPSTVAEHLLYLLGAHGVEHFFLNPGTDSAPLQEAMRTLPAAGVTLPAVHTSTFEAVSLAAAHGYYQVTGRPQCLFVHVDAGTQNLGAMMHDAFRDRAGVIIIAGHTPYEEGADSRGGRNGYIQWLQDVPDQVGIVRPYTKACIEITRPEMLDRVVGRAVQLATSYPAGPVYLTVSRDVLMDSPLPRASRTVGFAVPAPAAMEVKSVQRFTDLLAGAKRPLLVTSRLGRQATGFDGTTRLAELLGMEVVRGADCGPVSIPTLHPLHRRAPARSAAAIRAADVIVVAECDVPWIPKLVQPAPGAKVLLIDPDPLHPSMPMWTFPFDHSVTADGPTAIYQLIGALEARAAASPELARAWSARAAAATAEPAPLGPPQDPERLSALDVLQCLNQVLTKEDVVVEEAVTNSGLLYQNLVRELPGTLCGAFAPGLGWALGGALGVKMAHPTRRVVALCGDGSLLFSVPTSALMMSAAIGAPFLTVVLNNGGYRASRLPVYDLFPEGASALAGDAVGTRFTYAPDFAGLAQACHASGERVEGWPQLADALRRGLQCIESGTSALVDVQIHQN